MLPNVQASVPQQAAVSSASRVVDDRVPGILTCGVQSAKNFQRFVAGVEEHCATTARSGSARLGRTKGNATAGLNLSWVDSHMAKSRSDEIVEMARGTAMRTLMNACIMHGTGLTAMHAKALLSRFFGPPR